MTQFIHQRCFVHPSREAVSLCLECRRAFCRECVVDHDGRLICAACLARVQAPAAGRRGALQRLFSAAGLAVAILLCWILFYMFGRLLMLAEPAHHSFDDHEQEQHQ
ncbi:MAG: rhomboid family protein [Bryobacteraceae bacterium]|jgi:hypothetical protein